MKSSDPLAHYKAKRNFDITPEPEDAAPTPQPALSFVIQKHAARRLHYDFRLELDGTLKSWAVPKGPSFDPAQKRMAVHVEDHPLSYGSFEGVIPPKQYGAGTVIVWDRGWWEPIGDAHEGYRSGRLKFRLHGEKLRGAWTLVRLKQNAEERQESWLLIKERDEAARPESDYSVVEALPDSVIAKPLKPVVPTVSQGARRAPLPAALEPQLATLVDRPPPGDWIYELKFDGYRILARAEHGRVRLITRNGNDWTAKLPALAGDLEALGLESAWLDGEVVVLDADGKPDFGLLQTAFADARTDPVRYFVFDLPFHGGYDLRAAPLTERRALLKTLLKSGASERLRFSEDFDVSGADMLKNACRLKLEGVIGKRRDAPYTAGRSTSWIKLKCTERQEFVIVGYSEPRGSRVGVGALLLAYHDEAGKLRYAGRVGTGLSDALLADLKNKLEARTVERTPLHQPPREARGTWVKPQLVAEVSFAGWTREGLLRQAVFHGLRDDKPAAAITRETAQEPPTEEEMKPLARTPKPKRPANPEIAGVRITHPERVIDPSTGTTKLGLATYYHQAAAKLLPHLLRRPVSVLRAPDGIEGELFFQKHGEATIPGAKQLDPAFDPGHPPLLEIASLDALIGAVQMNVIELHTWNATTKAIEQPDRMTFDLDPGEGVEWPVMQEAAQLVRVLLEELGLKSLLKTSGGKGLHVVVPLTPREDWETVKAFSKAVTEHLAAVVPQRFVAKSGPRNRVGKIFVDYLRNGRGQTTVSAFSVRARPGMGVSVPCTWEELPGLTGGAHWTVANVADRLAADLDPWADYAKIKQTLTEARKRLGRA